MINHDAISNLGYDPDTPRRDFEFNLHRDIDQYTDLDDRDIGAYMREIMQGTGYDIDEGKYTDSDDPMSIQDLAVMRGHDEDPDELRALRNGVFDEDLHDYDEETYNEMLMDTGDF